ncbi:MAG: glycoside hydrolase 43 family protein [Verrucomicrobia bacterium]|nr:glycoside hydrolase 43 family protein [Verrucomicrobiota bacterium]
MTTPLAPWLPDLGDGHYQNPVLFADYSDPDAIRVGEDYWLTSSSFSHVPGLPILHSRDLVNWTLVNHALPRLVPEAHFAQPRHGAGVWAPSIRYHAGKFWIFYPDPDFGLYVVTADDPRGTWSEPTMVKAGKGLIDPCPLWDDDGSVYLVHGWAKSRAGICNRVTLHRLTADGRSVADEGRTIIDGDTMAGWKTIEGPKLYKRDGYYFVFAPAGGVTDGYQAVFRAREIFGPYESRIVLERGATEVNGPHQGAWVDTPAGEHWFLHFQERPAYGRIVHLQPMQWGADGWPRMGVPIGGAAEGRGEPVNVWRKPAGAGAVAPAVPATSDEFAVGAPGRQWQWQANPQPAWTSSGARSGWLRLKCLQPGPTPSLWDAGNLLMQKFPAPKFTATTLLEFAPGAAGERAGLVVFGYDYAWLGLRQTVDGLRLVLAQCAEAQTGSGEVELASAPVAGARVMLRVSVGAGAQCQFSFSVDGGACTTIGPAFQARSSKWVGAKVGVFAAGGAGAAGAGHADFDWFRLTG